MFLFLLFQILIQPIFSQFASRTMSTTFRNNAVVACECFVAHQIENTQVISQFPHFGFVAPHKRSVNKEVFVHCQINGSVERMHKGVSTIGISTIISFRYSRYQMTYISRKSQRSCKANKQHVTTRNKCEMMVASSTWKSTFALLAIPRAFSTSCEWR